MSRCFVAQPFDQGEFDKRYDQVYEPAIRAAGLEPYRVDQDPGATIVIDTVVTEIRSCTAFFVDITTDNPNVWFELGLAIAHSKRPCIVCAKTRTKFPFDVQHRQVIPYRTEAPGDFADLQQKITSRLKAIVEQQRTVEAVEERLNRSPQSIPGLSDLEVLAMTVIAGEARYLNGAAHTYSVYNEMEKAGYMPAATSVAIRRLTRSTLVTQQTATDDRGDEIHALALTEPGWEWVEDNLDRLMAAEKDRALADEIPF